MKSSEVREKYLKFFAKKEHKVIAPASLVPKNDPTTLFTTAGMQPLIPYLLGESHPQGKRLVNSQPCFRAQDIDEVGDNRHTTFFEMLGNWSLGNYFKEEQLSWVFEFLMEEVQLDPNKFYVTVFSGDEKYNLSKDTESAEIWKELFSKYQIQAKDVMLGSVEHAAEVGTQGGRIFYYDQKKNWWSRSGSIDAMPEGEPGGPNSEMFYEFTQIEHDQKYGKYCHPNCDCGRFLEIGNSVFMQYQKQEDNSLKELPNKNVDFGGGLERIEASSKSEPDVFKGELFWPIIDKIAEISGKEYVDNRRDFRVIADHLKAAVFILNAGVEPSNEKQGYVLRRLIRRAVRKGKGLKINHLFLHLLIEPVINIYQEQYPELVDKINIIEKILSEEETKFQAPLNGVEQYRVDLEAAIKHGLNKKIKNITIFSAPGVASGAYVYEAFQTYGVPPDLSKEVAEELGLKFNQEEYDEAFKKHQELSKTASAGMFKGGLGEQSEITTKYHTTTHLLHASLRKILGEHVQQKGSNITSERLRFDFSHSEKLTEEQLKQVEDLVNEKIKESLPVTSETMDKQEALSSGALGFFIEKYGDRVTVYTIGDFSKEICGGPHITNTKELGSFKIIKEESAGAGIRRIYATLS